MVLDSLLTKSHPYYFMWQSISHIMFIISEKKMKKCCIIGNTVWFQTNCNWHRFLLFYCIAKIIFRVSYSRNYVLFNWEKWNNKLTCNKFAHFINKKKN